MRFNAKELATVVQQTVNYDKEGYLLMKEKQEGFFKKSEAYISRYIRLKGNLLFYFKSKDSRSDPLGVIVLERCAVELAVDDEVDNGFLLVFEGEDHPFRFGASSEAVRDEWIQALHIASHECLKMQLQSLREQLQARTGNDLVNLPGEANSTVDFESQSDNASQDPVLEISIDADTLPSSACSNLPNDTSDVPPNALVVVHTMLPPQQQMWMHHNHTEIVEKNNSPQFLKTIGFGDKFGIDTATKVRLTVHHVVERMTGAMTQIGQVIFTLQELLLNNDLCLTLTLRTRDQKEKGNITVTSWINDERVSLNDLQTQKSGSYSKRDRTFSMGCHSHNLQTHYNDIMKRSFRFATNNERSMIQVSEYMAESKWTFEMPIQLLRLWIDEEKQMISALQDLGELTAEWEDEQLMRIKAGADAAVYYTNALEKLESCSGLAGFCIFAFPDSLTQNFGMKSCDALPFDQGFVRQEASDYCMSMVVSYNQHAAHLSDYAGVTFKRSSDKGKQELEFVPINLHVERMIVSSEGSPADKVYDITTVGAFSAHCRDTKNGGLKRLLHNVRSSRIIYEANQQLTKSQQACSILNEVTELRIHLRSQCEKVLQTAEQGKMELLLAGITSMKEKVAKLESLCAEPLVMSAADSYLSAKRNANTSEGTDSSSLKNISEDQDSVTDQSRKSHSGFTKQSTMEPWDVTRLNMEAAFVCLVSVVEYLTTRTTSSTSEDCEQLVDIGGPSDEGNKVSSALQEVKPALTKLQGFLDIVCSRLALFLTFVTIMENKGQIRTASDLKIRRDIVNAHAITTLVSSFTALTQTDVIYDAQFTEQLCSVGLLYQLEGLLSCYSSELCMLEDTIIGVDDLSQVTFRLVHSDDFMPKASLGSFVKEGPYADITRHNIIIDVPVTMEVFSRLPRELQQGKQIRVTAVSFNIGINEQATLAEKFGSTALQDKLNMESFAKVYEYYSHYSKHFDDPLDKSLGLGSLSHMIKMLQNNVMTKKSKNVEVLHMAADVTRAMKGLRATFCKSGKDRTAMAVTLEMVHILQRHHNLASHVFMQSLDCLRSVGCRRDNTLKNTGVKKYAFISLQMLYIPKLYRAPSGTYGNVQT